MIFSNRPDIKTGIFLDSGDPRETKLVLDELGFIDGQTTNPSLVSRNPDIASKFDNGEKLTSEELLSEYKKIVQEISGMIPGRSVSIEVYADKDTKAEEMISQAEEMYTWIDTAHIKLPTTPEGLKAARYLTERDFRVNMTLVFKQEQAAAVHSATTGVKKGNVFVSPFIGRLDDLELRGMDVVGNITKMYREVDSHVEVLAASIRSLDHLMFLLFMQVNIVTVPFKVLRKWIRIGAPNPDRMDFDVYKRVDEIKYFFGDDLKEIPMERIDTSQDFDKFNIDHKLTEVGLQKFADDWNKLIK
jgi:transaldolase